MRAKKTSPTTGNAAVAFRMDSQLKSEADELFARLGMNLTTAINLFVRHAIHEQGIPFAISQNIPNRETQLAIAEGVRIMHDPKIKGCANIRDLVKALKK
ncbi:MAG: type II toxin-antitoxin system RelB/DinJ family antitoxin [Kiritimatiellaeota bacterium]|nr:type II toxin-antitoxin system RelB/DinJ family antitoxin [Kiritimatiellota bacterium]